MADVTFNAQPYYGTYAGVMNPGSYARRGDGELAWCDSDMWNIYLDEVKEEDDRIIGDWKEGANGIIVFVSLTVIYCSLCSSR